MNREIFGAGQVVEENPDGSAFEDAEVAAGDLLVDAAISRLGQVFSLAIDDLAESTPGESADVDERPE